MSGLRRRIKAFLDKEDFDYTRGDVDPDEFHKTYILMARLFNVMDDTIKPWWMYITPVTVGLNACIGVLTTSYSLYLYVSLLDFHSITESGTYFLVLFYKLLIISSCFLNRKNYCHFFMALRKDFEYIRTKGKKYSEAFFENQKLTFKASLLSGVFTGFIGGGMMVCSILALLYTLIFLEKDHKRPLPYPFTWYKFKNHETPYYEFVFTVDLSLTFHHTYVYIFMIQTQVMWVREITCKADIIVWNIRDLLADISPATTAQQRERNASLVRHRMRDIVAMHHDMIELLHNYAAVFKKCLLYEQKCSSPIICLTAYSAAEKFKAGEVPLILILLCSAVVVLVLIPSYLCTFLAEKVQSIGDACWAMPFWRAGRELRPYAVLMMQRAARQLPIQAAGFEDISLQTYSTIITRAYSCFNMLRQANFDLNGH